MPGSAASSPETTRLRVGTAVMSRSTRKTRSARSTENVSVAGTSAMPTTTRSNTLHGSRKNATLWTVMRAVSSITNTARMMRSTSSSAGPAAAITLCEVSSPRMTALTMMSDMMTRSVRGSSTMVRSQAITIVPL